MRDWLADLELSYRLSSPEPLPEGFLEALLEHRAANPTGWLVALARRADLTEHQQVLVINEAVDGWLVLGLVAKHASLLAPEVFTMARESSYKDIDTAPLLANPSLTHTLQRELAAELANWPEEVSANLYKNPRLAPDLRAKALTLLEATECLKACSCTPLASRADLSASEALAVASHKAGARMLLKNTALGRGVRRALLQHALTAGWVPGAWAFADALEEDEVNEALDSTSGLLRNALLANARVPRGRQAEEAEDGQEMLAHNRFLTRETQELVASRDAVMILAANTGLHPEVARRIAEENDFRELSSSGFFENPALPADLVAKMLTRAREMGDEDAVGDLRSNPACPVELLDVLDLEAHHYPLLIALMMKKGCDLEALSVLARGWDGAVDDLVTAAAEFSS